MNAQIVNYLPAGAVAPSEKAGIEFEMDMLADAVAFHQNGDDEDAPCCTFENPCDLRTWQTGRIRELAALVGQADPTPTQTVEETDQAQTPAGSAGSARRTVADPASEAQLGFIAKLAAERETDKIGTFPARTLAEIQAGHPVSKTRASSLITALKNAQIRTDAEVQAGPRASAPQIALIRQLVQEQGRTLLADPAGLSKADASEMITLLMKARDTAPEVRTETPAAQVTEGMYRTPDGEIYKVQVAVHGSGRLYAKRLQELDEPRELKKGTRTHDFVYEAGALQKLTPEMKMTLEQAKEWGALYGTCCRCGLTLTDEKSIEAGIGPVCGDKF